MSAAPELLLPYQRRFLAAADAERVVVVEKSRRTGFSWVAALKAALTAAAREGSDVFYTGYNLEMAREFIDYVAEWARSIEPAAAEVKESFWSDPEHPEKAEKAYRVEFRSGNKVLALPSVARALRGMQGLVIIDEAAFHDELEELLKAAFALLIWGGSVIVISTHQGDLNPFAVLVNDVRAGRRPYWLQRVTFDEALEEGLYKRICLKSGKAWSEEGERAWRAEIIAFYGDGAEEELFCVPSQSTGAFLPLPLIEARMEEGAAVIRWEPEPGFELWAEHLRRAEAAEWAEDHLAPVLSGLRDEPHCFGFDVGRRGDLSVLWVLAIGERMVRRMVLVAEMRAVPFGQQREVLWHVIGKLPRFRGGAMDATGLGMQLAEETVQRWGSRVVPVMLNEPWYRENMAAWKAAFEDATITLPKDREILGDLRAVKLVRGVARVPLATKDEEGKRRHGDAAIASALAYAASRADAEVYEYRAAQREKEEKRWQERPDEEAEDRREPGRAWLPSLRGRLYG